MCHIHAYNHEDAGRKQQFHQDASRYLRSVGLYLGQHGFTLMLVRSNKGGIAVGGEVYATYMHPERQQQLDVVIESDIVADFSPRVDHVIIHARWVECHLPEQEQKSAAEQQQVSASESKPKRSSKGKQKTIASYLHTLAKVGPVCYLNPGYSSEVTALCLLRVLEASLVEGELVRCTSFKKFPSLCLT